MAEERRPRSRFDTEPTERPARSRFDTDRRSRSPVARDSDSHRERSPVARDAVKSPASDGSTKPLGGPAAAAAAAAARINASIQAKKGIQHVDVPPIRAVLTPPVVKSPATSKVANVSSEIYQQDGDYIKDIEINDLRNRYTLTKGAFQKTIKDKTGADVTTRGEYYPDKNMATAASPPLYLRITSTSKEGLEAAVKMIEETMTQDLPNLVDERRFRRGREPEQFERDELGRRKWPEEKLYVQLEPINGFNLRAQVVGRGGEHVKYIQGETYCKVQIKGRGSGFMEPLTNQEADEPMYLHIAGPKPEEVARAKMLAEELLEKVKQDYQDFKERGPPQRYNDRPGYGDRNDRDRDRSASYGYNNHNNGGYGSASAYGASADPRSPTTGAHDQNTQAVDYNTQYAQWAAYYAANPTEDPYIQQGGFAAYMAQWYGSYYGQAGYAQTQSPAPGYDASAATAPPPPPPPAGGDSGAPGAGSYTAVPPPPGL